MSAAPSNSTGSTGERQYSDEIKRKYSVRKQLTRERTAQLEALGERRLRELVRRVVDDDATSEKRSKLLQEKENYRIYEVLDETTITMKGVLLLQSSSCEEVMELLATPSAHALYSDLLGSSLYGDSAVLHDAVCAPRESSSSSLGAATPLSTSLAVHWLMLRDVSVHLPSRDFVFMRYHQLYASDDPASTQRVGWGASVWESLEFPTCPPLWNASIVARSAFTKCGFVVEASDHSDATRVTFFVTTPSPASQSDRQWLLKLASTVRFIPSAIVNHRIRHNQLVDKRDWISRDACALCTQSFNKLFKRQHHCRLCGVAVCSKCSSLRHESAVRVCLSCVHGEDTSALWGSVSMARKKLGSSSHSNSLYSASSSTMGTSLGACSWDQSAAAAVHGGTKESWTSSTDDPVLGSTGSMSSDYSFSGSGTRGTALEDFLENDPLAQTLSFDALSISSSVSSNGGGSGNAGDEDEVTANSSFEYALTYAKGNPWPDAPMPPSESEHQRLERIKTLNLSQQYAKENLKELLDFARTSIDCNVAAVAVVSVSKILLATSVGLAGDQLPRDVGFEAHAIMAHKPLVVLDTQKDERFAMNPLVSAMNIRFYIGVPLVTRDGVVVGALSLGDTHARDKVSGADLRSLQRIASRVVAKMDAGSLVTSLSSAKAAACAKVSGMLLI